MGEPSSSPLDPGRPSARIYAHTVELAPDAVTDLSSYVQRSGSTAWIRDGDGMVGVGELTRQPFADVAEAGRWWADLVQRAVVTSELGVDLAGSGLLAFGSFAFDPDNTSAQSVLIVPRLVLGRRHGKVWLTAIALEPIRTAPRLWDAEPGRPVGEVEFSDGAVTGAQWAEVVAEAVARIDDGERGSTSGWGLAKVVLARSVVARADGPIDARWLVARLSAEYRRCWTYLVDGTVGATPEMLIRREQGLATSRVLAGTIRRTGDEQQDLALASLLAESSKDRQEHEYAVASVAAALSPYCTEMFVPDAPYVLQLPNVLHLATDVTAVAEQDVTLLELAAALHPSAAVCGTPTALARATIAELENLDRQRYAGPVGWIDGDGDGEWAIALRGGQLDPTDPTRIQLFAGCGIVTGSDPVAELAESEAKLIPMRSALGSP